MADPREKELAQKLRMQNRAGLTIAGEAMNPASTVTSITDAPARLSLDEAYQRYKSGKAMGRSDLFGLIVAEVNELKRRIGSVDEAAVAVIEQRVSSLETVIGKALNGSGAIPATAPEPKRKGWPKGKPRKSPPAVQELKEAIGG